VNNGNKFFASLPLPKFTIHGVWPQNKSLSQLEYCDLTNAHNLSCPFELF